MAGIAVRIPPLRDRREDITLLAWLFLSEVCTQMGQSLELGPDVAEALERHDWPGNVRELRQTISRAAYLSDGPRLSVGNLAHFDEMLDDAGTPAPATASVPMPLQALLDDVARDYCRKLLAESPSVTAAAKTAGFSARGFQLMLKRLGVRKDE